MRFAGWFLAIPLLLVALIAGACGYAIGVSSSATVAGAAVTPAVYPVWGFGWFFPFFGFFFFLILVFVIFGAFKRAAWGGRGGYGPGRGYGPGGWYKPGANDAFDQWHRRAHGEPDQPAGAGPSAGESAGGEPTNAPWSPPTPPKDK